MYKIKKEEIKKYKKYGLVRNLSIKTGITEGYISNIINGKKPNISKVVAYAFVKAISNDLEIENLFDIM